jgi:hypothetical protein
MEQSTIEVEDSSSSDDPQVLPSISELSIPQEALLSLPDNQLSVREFRQIAVPIVPKAVKHDDPRRSFRHEPPTSYPQGMRTVPPESWIRVACSAVNAARKEGAQSVADWCTPALRYPLWAPFFWSLCAHANGEQDGWAVSDRWISLYSSKPPSALTVADEAREILASLPWNLPVSAHGSSTEVAVLRQLLSDDLLNDDIINMAMWWLASRTQADGMYRTVLVAPLSFQHNLLAGAEKGEYMAASLRRYRHEVVAGRRQRLYFPLHTGGNHWIAAVIDFSNRTIAYGEL